jgi:hypothetical protein
MKYILLIAGVALLMLTGCIDSTQVTQVSAEDRSPLRILAGTQTDHRLEWSIVVMPDLVPAHTF